MRLARMPALDTAKGEWTPVGGLGRAAHDHWFSMRIGPYERSIMQAPNARCGVWHSVRHAPVWAVRLIELLGLVLQVSKRDADDLDLNNRKTLAVDRALRWCVNQADPEQAGLGLCTVLESGGTVDPILNTSPWDVLEEPFRTLTKRRILGELNADEWREQVGTAIQGHVLRRCALPRWNEVTIAPRPLEASLP